MAIYRDKTKIYEITKQYNDTGFPEDETSLGYSIDVYQESINKVFREYLVNFKYLQRILENYGFYFDNKGRSSKIWDYPMEVVYLMNYLIQ